jgi:AcrR family transcriptional regulator
VTESADAPAARREPLSREKVVRTAVAMADEAGGEVPSTRRLADRLGVRAMALYHHFRNKDVLLDGMVDAVFAEIELPGEDVDWRTAMRRRAASARAALVRHPWAIGLMDSRPNAGPATLRHHDAVIGSLRAGGFTIIGAAHAFSVLDSYIYGFVIQELALPFKSSDELEAVGEGMMARMPEGEYPHLMEMFTDRAMQPGYDYADEFEVGLELVVDGLARRREDWR